MNINKLIIAFLTQTTILSGIACNRINSSTDSNSIVDSLNHISFSGPSFSDSICNLSLFAEYKLGESIYFKTRDEYPTSICLFNKDLFFLNYTDNKLVVFNTNNKTANTNEEVNEIIKSNSSKYFGLHQIIVNEEYYFIGFLKAIICVNKKDYSIVNKIILDDNINHFSVNENTIFVFTSDSINSYNIKGEKLKSSNIKNPLTGHFINADQKVYISEMNHIMVFDPDKFEISSMPHIDLPIQNPYLSCVIDNYAIWYPYMSRDQLIYLNLKDHSVKKIIKLSKNKFLPSKGEIELEEGNPNFSIISDKDGDCYVIVLKNNKLQIFRLN